MGRIEAAHAETLRRLTLDDESFVSDVLGGHPVAQTTPALDPRTQGLVRLGALIALDAGASTVERAVTDVLAAGATHGDIVDVLLSVASCVGSARLVSAAPRIAIALGYDIESALEHLDHDR